MNGCRFRGRQRQRVWNTKRHEALSGDVASRVDAIPVDAVAASAESSYRRREQVDCVGGGKNSEWRSCRC